MSFRKVAVLGLGKVGHLAAELLAESGFEVTGIDAGLPVVASGAGFLADGDTVRIVAAEKQP